MGRKNLPELLIMLAIFFGGALLVGITFGLWISVMIRGW